MPVNQSSTIANAKKYGYDISGSRTYRDIDSSIYAGNNKDQAYTYDGLDRLKTYDGGTLSGTTITGTPVAEQDWGLDALGNWGTLAQTGTGAFSQTRAHNAANEVSTATGWATTAHDAVGNMTTMPRPIDPTVSPGYTCVYDAWNRLVKVSAGTNTVAEYEYDGLNRRIVKSLGTGTVREHFYYNEEWQELEVRQENSGTESANPREQFVWHPYYTDALATRFYDSDVNNSTGVVQHYFTHDANFNVTAALDTTGNVVERYDYSPYGEITYFDNAFGSITDTTIAHRRAYTGQRLDAETGLYQYRNRYYHPRLGRFISRDPIGYIGSPWNLYEYVDSNPIIFSDIEGLSTVALPWWQAIGGGIGVGVGTGTAVAVGGAVVIVGGAVCYSYARSNCDAAYARCMTWVKTQVSAEIARQKIVCQEKCKDRNGVKIFDDNCGGTMHKQGKNDCWYQWRNCMMTCGYADSTRNPKLEQPGNCKCTCNDCPE